MKNPFDWLNRSRIVLTLYTILVVIVLVISHFIYSKRKADVQANIEATLKTIAELKASEISTWMNERVSDASVLSHQYFLA